MSRIHQQAALLGLATTVLLAALFVLGVFDDWEHKTIDMRFAYARLSAEPMSDAIVHVDIDDGAIDTVGRWPWPRTMIGYALDEMARAEARVVVLDLMFGEPSFDAGEDEHLARAMAGIPTILAFTPLSGWEFGDVWTTDAGVAARTRLLDYLCQDIAVDPTRAATAVGLSSEQRRRFLERPNMFRQVAVWRYLSQRSVDDDPPHSREELIAELSPDAARGIEIQYASLIKNAWDNYRAWSELAKYLPGEKSSDLSRDQAPIPVLAEQAAMIGFVNTEPDSDGSIRRTRVSLPTPAGTAVPLGMAAVLTYQGLDPRQVILKDDEMRVGDVAYPLESDRLWLYWPSSSSDPRWLGLLRRSPGDIASAGHLSMGRLVELARQRVILEDQRDERDRLARDFGKQVLGKQIEEHDQITEKLLEEIRNEIDFWFADEPIDPDAEDDPDEREKLILCWKFREHDQAVRNAEEFIAGVEPAIRQALHDKLVFVGFAATGTDSDRHSTAVGSRTPGVIAHAVLADMLLQGRSLHFTPYLVRVLLTVLMGLVATTIAVRFGGVLSGLLTAIALGIYILIGGMLLFDSSALIVPMVGPVTTGLSAWLTCTAFQAAVFQRDKLRITRQFKARVSGQLVDFLIENPDAVSMSGDEREVTVLFCDLAKFTSISEQLGGRATVSMLNRYMCRLTELLIEHRGYVNKFLGDGLMAFWSAFAYDADQASHATRAVIACHKALRELNEHPDLKDFPSLDMRAGITTGRVIVGDCGAPPHLNDYTVIGDAVNLASRLEAANKQFGTSILVDGPTWELVRNEEGIESRFLGRIAVVGQSKPVMVHEILTSPSDSEERELCGQAVSAFMEGALEESKKMWEEYIARYGDRPFVQLYLDAISREGPAASGVLILQSK